MGAAISSSPSRVRRSTHRGAVLSAIRTSGPLSRSALATRTGLTRAALTLICNELIDAGVIYESHALTEERHGRKAIALNIDPAGAYVVGVGLNFTEQPVVLAGLNGQVVAGQQLSGALNMEPAEFVNQVRREVIGMARSAQITPSRLVGIGLAALAISDPQARVLTSRAVRWERVQLADMLEAALDLPVVQAGMADAVNIVESYLGDSAEIENLLLFNVGLGIGSSLRLDGRPVRSTIGEVGQALVCWEDAATGKAVKGRLIDTATGWGVLRDMGVIQEFARSIEDYAGLRRLLDGMLDDADRQSRVRERLVQAGRVLGAAVCSIGHAFGPDAIVLAGPLGRHAAYAQGVREIVNADYGHTYTHIPQVFTSTVDATTASVHLALDAFVFENFRLPSEFDGHLAKRMRYGLA